MCVEGRLSELPALWRLHKGLGGLASPNAATDNRVISNAFSPKPTQLEKQQLVTAEAPLGPSKNQLQACQPVPPPLQPHQGRNPCQERNLAAPVQQVRPWGGSGQIWQA